MKRIGMGALALLALVITVGLLPNTQPVYAQDGQAEGSVTVAQPVGANHPFFVTMYQNGSPVRSGEDSGYNWVGFYKVSVGEYELHVEAAGYKTQVMRIHVAAGQETKVSASAQKGDGTQIWGNGPTLAELIVRLAKVEVGQCKCQKK